MNTAIYIDADNVSYKCIDDILSKATQYNIISKKIYADWTQDNMKKWADRAKKYGFEGVQCFGNSFKQTSDIYMVTDIINDIYSNNYLECIILATSDIDFTRLCQIVKVKNKKLIIFTPQKSSLANMSEHSTLLKKVNKRKYKEEYSDEMIDNYFDVTIESEGNDNRISKLDLLKIPFENGIEKCNVMNISNYKKRIKEVIDNYTLDYKFDLNHVDVELKKFPKYFGVIRKRGSYKVIAIYHLHQYKTKDLKNENINKYHHEILEYYSPEKLISLFN